MAARSTSSDQSRPDRSAAAPRMRATAFGLIGVGVVLLAAALVAFVVLPRRAPSLTGSLINPPAPAPAFRLTDQFGRPIALSDFRGKVVVLSFLYTHCPDVCPLITQKLHQAYGMLGPDAGKAEMLAITVDPANDTVAQVHAYSADKDMLQKWHFLVGSRTKLAPIWAAYGVAAQPDGTQPNGASQIDHTAPVFIIDPDGQMRALLDVNFAPADVVQDVHALMR